jgi:hypothetical protein
VPNECHEATHNGEGVGDGKKQFAHLRNIREASGIVKE